MVSPKGESVWLIIYEVKTILIMFSDLSPENPKTRNPKLVGYQIYLIDEENSLRKLFSTLKVNCILFLSHTDLRNDEEIVQYGLRTTSACALHHFLTEQTQWSKIQLRNIQIEDLFKPGRNKHRLG